MGSSSALPCLSPLSPVPTSDSPWSHMFLFLNCDLPPNYTLPLIHCKQSEESKRNFYWSEQPNSLMQKKNTLFITLSTLLELQTLLQYFSFALRAFSVASLVKILIKHQHVFVSMFPFASTPGALWLLLWVERPEGMGEYCQSSPFHLFWFPFLFIFFGFCLVFQRKKQTYIFFRRYWEWLFIYKGRWGGYKNRCYVLIVCLASAKHYQKLEQQK